MANNTPNIMSIAPNQPVSSPRTTSQSTQPRYKPPARFAARKFSSTLDQVNAKLDELKQTVGDAMTAVQNDSEPETPAQGMSTTPQDAPSQDETATPNDSRPPAKEETKPADIFLSKKPSTARDEISEPVDAQPPENFFAANNMAYLLGTNAETLLATKPVVAPPTTDAVQSVAPNLMTLLPQSNGNAQSMLNMLGGRTWRQLDISSQAQAPVEVSTQPQAPQVVLTAQAPVEVSTQPQAPQVQLTAQAPVEVPTQPQTPQIQLTSQAPVEVPTQPQAPQVRLTAQAPVEVTTTPQAPQVQLTAQAPVETPTTPQAQQVVVQSQPQIAVVQSTADDRPAQNVSTLLNANAQVEETPTTQPVTAPQAPPQQFEQSPQRDAQNFQGQAAFQAPTNDAPQAQPVATGSEVFAVPVTPTNDVQPPQPIQPAQAPDAPPAPPEDFDVPAQIVRQARLIRSAENTQMVIKLNPEHLGELTLRVSVSANGAVNASFHSDNAQVRTIIENSLVQLRQELNNVGLKVENVQVFAGLSDGNLMSGQGGQAWQQSRQQRQTRRINFDALERDIDAAAPVAENIATEGVDYSV